MTRDKDRERCETPKKAESVETHGADVLEDRGAWLRNEEDELWMEQIKSQGEMSLEFRPKNMKTNSAVYSFGASVTH